MSDLRVLVVGTGSIGLRHLRLFRECRGLSVEVCDIRPAGLLEAAQVAPGARQWLSLDQALESRPEIVIVATPPNDHAHTSIAALHAGCHVFCEKPLADTLDSAAAIVAAAKDSNRLLNVGYVQRFLPEIQKVRELVISGAIGEVCYVRFEVATLRTLELSRSRHQAEQFAAAALDYAYGFDTFWWVLERSPLAVLAKGAFVPGLPFVSNPNVIAAILEYSSAFIGEIHIDYVAHPDRCSYIFQGTEGYLVAEQGRHSIVRADRHSGKTTEESFSVERDDLMRRQRDDFLEAVSGGHAIRTSAEDAFAANLGVDALVRSLHSGCREMLSSAPY